MTVKTDERSWERYFQGTDSQFKCDQVSLGPWTSYSLKTDPIHMAFVLSRYKFCAKMLEGKDLVVEMGCGDGFGIPIVSQFVKHLHCVDWDERSLEGCQKRLSHLKNVSYECVNLNATTLKLQADAAFSLDVIEHVDPAEEGQFMENICRFLKPSSVLITGTPNIAASPYASPQSASQHINLKSPKTLKQLTEKYFKHVFSFGMNDEVVHTGYSAMCHYIWAVGAEKR